MQLFLNEVIGTLVQLILFLIIPILWWGLTARKEENFLSWIGLKKVKTRVRKKFWYVYTVSVFCFMVLSIFILFLVRGTETAASAFTATGVSAFPAAIVYSFGHTALAEELLFRGFLCKRFVLKFGFVAGNFMQSTLFGVMHGVMFYSSVGLGAAILIVLFTGAVGWCLGYINEKCSDGSILPGWTIHGMANLFSAAAAMFTWL
ncbi:CPBP family intramembrane glutamic endopeptidase [Gorillibacterium massiliense]|uniref:CPBP family intramembrane glutamic endopeptidase n=1 Tax=Gorillibacterium massiliense TaxID=1280390 RepID=UPI0004B1261D|nr:CPBP family intramembrane glutamic endopeptidase [Gorillibacterium massiliense]